MLGKAIGFIYLSSFIFWCYKDSSASWPVLTGSTQLCKLGRCYVFGQPSSIPNKALIVPLKEADHFIVVKNAL